MGMDVNGLHFNWTGWGYIGGAIRYYCEDYLANEKAMHGYESIEALGLESWDDYDGNCLDAMTHNGAEAWPAHVALKVRDMIQPRLNDGDLAEAMKRSNCTQEEIDWTHKRMQDFLNAITERPDSCIFL